MSNPATQIDKINIGMVATVTYNKYYIYLQLCWDGAGMHVIAGGVHFGCMIVPASAYTLGRSRVEVQTWECFRTHASYISVQLNVHVTSASWLVATDRC